MKNIEEILKGIGVEVPEEKLEAFRKEVSENYKTVAEVEKKNGRIAELEGQLKTANETLDGFKDVKPEELQKEIAKLTKSLADKEKEYGDNLKARDRKDAIARELDKVKFSSSYSKKFVEELVDSEEVHFENGKLYGLSEKLEEIKASHADAFASEEGEKKPVSFTESMGGGSKAVTMDDFYALKTSEERQNFIRQHTELFKKN